MKLENNQQNNVSNIISYSQAIVDFVTIAVSNDMPVIVPRDLNSHVMF